MVEMMANLVGNIKEFDIKGNESFESYSERMDLFFAVNDITEKVKRKVTFLTLCGPDLYQLSKSLTAPGKPMDKTYQEITDLLSGQLHPKPNVIVKRYRFKSRTRRSGESIAESLADLRHLSRHCEYAAITDAMIRDRLVCGVNDVGIQRKLLAEIGLTLKKVTAIASGMEMAAKESSAISGPREVHGLDHGRGRKEVGFRWGDRRHKVPDCHFRDKEFSFVRRKAIFQRFVARGRKVVRAP